MIDTEQFNKIEDMATASIRRLREDIIDLIVSRIMATDYDTLIQSNKLLIYKLQSSGMLYDDIIKAVAGRADKNEADIKKMFEDSYVSSILYDNKIYARYGIAPLPFNVSEQMLEILNEALKQTNGEFRNMTRTLADSGQNLYIRLLDDAYMKVRSGSFSYEQAIAEVVSTAVKDSAYVYYPSGHKDHIEVAARRAILCGVNQASIRSAVERCRERGWNHMIVSSHLGARTAQKGKPAYADHSAWQGKIYWLDRPDGVHESFIEVCGWGKGDGIGGWGCRHSAFAWTEGMGNPFDQFDKEENRKRYELVSRQRTKERRIRNTKMEIVGLHRAIDRTDNDELRQQLQDKYDARAAKLSEYNKDYKNFCAENELKPYNERLKTAEWNAKESRRAVVAANRATKTTQKKKCIDFGNIKNVSFSNKVQHTNISSDNIKTIKQTISDIGEKYNVRMDRFEIKDLTDKKYAGVPMFFKANDVNGRYESSLIINNSCDMWKSETAMHSVVEKNFFAGKTVRDFTIHEMAHIITFQKCETIEEYLEMEKEVHNRFIPGISEYNNRCMDGAETIAEAFVMYKNGVELKEEIMELINEFLEVYRND